MLLLYSFLYALAQIFLLPYEYFRRQIDVRARWLSEKLGGTARGTADADKCIWVHAVSVGEAVAAASFIKAFVVAHPGYRVVLSTITDTGQKVARERLGDMAEVVYLPLDFQWAFMRAIKARRPRMFVNMETELWPNMFRALARGGVPIILLNGRISDKSFRGYMRIKPFVKEMLKGVRLFCMQETLYAQRIIELGAERDNVIVTGSLKFDVKVKDEELNWARKLGARGPVIVAGSTHAGEEALLASVYLRLRENIEGLRMVIAPRHPERAPEVAEMLRGKGILYVRRTEVTGDVDMYGAVMLLDTVGELSSVYRVADVVVIGGSFVPHGGQNPLEAAYWGKPVVCGPNMGNFPFIREFYDNGAAIKTDADGLYGVLLELLRSPQRRASIGETARGLMLRSEGATLKAIRAIEERIGV